MRKASILAALRRLWNNMVDYVNNRTTWTSYDS